jgi:pilus assembly protein Flp/PilA
MFSILSEFVRDDSGATAIEYGLIAALVSIAGVSALELMGQSLTTLFTTVSDKLDNAVQAAATPAGP